jgi:hypothetical protein
MKNREHPSIAFERERQRELLAGHGRPTRDCGLDRLHEGAAHTAERACKLEEAGRSSCRDGAAVRPDPPRSSAVTVVVNRYGASRPPRRGGFFAPFLPGLERHSLPSSGERALRTSFLYSETPAHCGMHRGRFAGLPARRRAGRASHSSCKALRVQRSVKRGPAPRADAGPAGFVSGARECPDRIARQKTNASF